MDSASVLILVLTAPDSSHRHPDGGEHQRSTLPDVREPASCHKSLEQVQLLVAPPILFFVIEFPILFFVIGRQTILDFTLRWRLITAHVKNTAAAEEELYGMCLYLPEL